MDGFYQLANVFGGVEVCLKHPVHDVNSGANFPAGFQHLDAAQALAFVRQRDGLPNGDLDRTHRQQAFLDSVIHQLRAEGVLSDLTKLDALLSVAKQYVITDAGWNLLDFATEMRSLSSGNLVFHTLPIKGFATIDGQDANVIDPAYIASIVRGTFYPRPSPPQRHHRGLTGSRAITVDVLNGGNTTGLAARVAAALAGAGFRAGRVGNTSARSAAPRSVTGRERQPRPAPSPHCSARPPWPAVQCRRTRSRSCSAASATLPHIPASAAPGAPDPVIPTAGPQGGAVVAKNGIPCVN